MAEVSQILERVQNGDSAATEELLPHVYDELRKLAAHRLAFQSPGQTLQPTALVHEAYLRLVGDKSRVGWENLGHFFASASEAMRRILVENARRKTRQKHGGGLQRRDGDRLDELAAQTETREDLIALDEALDRLAATAPQAAEIVQLRYFGGFSLPEAAQTLGVSPRTADRLWAYARVWLLREMRSESPPN
jgi:RNA polymerase sigma factor (TIGR02999 family)